MNNIEIRSLKKKEINEKIFARGLAMAGEYTNTRTKTEFTCNLGHVWLAIPNNVLHYSGCPICSGKSKKSKDIINDLVKPKGFKMISGYVSMNDKAEFMCVHGHKWHSTPTHIINNGSGCPTCSYYGFNPDKPAWEYGFTRDGYLKYGITNDLVRRLNEHRKYGEINLVHERYHERGQNALDWERHIKTTHGGRYATKEQCPDGYTETLPIHLLEYLIK